MFESSLLMLLNNVFKSCSTYCFLLVINLLAFGFVFGQSPKLNGQGKAFIPNEIWEMKINDVSRSKNEFKIITPAIGSIQKVRPIKFLFETNAKERLFLRILNNENVELFSDKIEKQPYFSPEKLKLSPGLFYWIVETETDILFVGKFVFQPAQSANSKNRSKVN